MNKPRINQRIIALLVGILSPWAVISAEKPSLTENHADIRKAVKQYLTNKSTEQQFDDVQIDIGLLDPRLKLAKCDTLLNTRLRKEFKPGNLSVSVSCNNERPWKIYIQAKVSAYKSVYIAKASLMRGESIRASSVELAKRDITTLNGRYFSDINGIRGYIAKRTIHQGQVISPVLLTKAKLIKRGEMITIIADSSGVRVRMKGKALNDAAAGEQVRVKNKQSNRIIEGIAIKRGHVKVNLL